MGIPLKVRERKIRRGLFASSIKRESRHFHAVVVQPMAKKCTKKRDSRAKLLFCLINLLLFPSPSSLLKLPNTSCRYASSWYTPCDWSIGTVYFNIYVIQLFSRAQSLTNNSSM